MPSVVLVDESDGVRSQMTRALTAEGYEVIALSDCAKLEELIDSRKAALILGRIAGGPFAALEAVRRVQATRQIPILFVPGESSEAVAIAALRARVSDYLPPPALPSDIVAAVRRALQEEAKPLGIVGEAGSVARIKAQLPRIASSSCSVLITGETGTGKELIAEHIHSLGPRSKGPFVALNCAAIPDTLLESELFGYERGAFTGATRRADGLLHAADRGTLFLDEVGDMTLAAQSKVLRALETGKVRRVGGHLASSVDVRFIAATNQNVDAMVQDGRFRADLYFRLNVARVELPPLRERPEDIPLLVRHFLDSGGASSTTVSADAASALVGYSWPGNIRELKNVLQATLVYLTDSIIRREDLPRAFLSKAAGENGAAQTERSRLLAVLEQTQWNKSRAAESLQWSRMTLYRKMSRYGVSSERPKAPAAFRVSNAGA